MIKAASKVRRGMAFEIDDCKFHLEAMKSPDYQYQPLIEKKRIIEKLQESKKLMIMQLQQDNEKLKKDIKGLIYDVCII